jgi:lysophospholipase L1-like esterase
VFVVAVAILTGVALLVPAGAAAALGTKPGDGVEKSLIRVFHNDQQFAPTGVVSLGDSYSSGLGAGGYDDDCDRTSQAWGMAIFEDDVSPEDRLLLACSGAQIDDVYDQLDELADSGGSGGRLITLTVGGNDIGFAGELANCFVPFVGCAGRESILMSRIDALVEPLTELYLDVQAAAPGDVLIVGGYPLLVPDPDVRSNCRALTPLLSTAERQMIRRLGVALNQAIDEAATAAGVRSAGAQLETAFDGHEACANGPDDWLNGLKLGSTSNEPDEDAPQTRWDAFASFVRESFHPNGAGQAGYAQAFTAVWETN